MQNLARYQLPFFDLHHRELAARASAWVAEQHVDERDDRAACSEWVKRLGAAGFLRYCVPAGPDGVWGGALDRLDSRSLVVLRECLAFESPLADFAFAMQGLGSGPISLSDNAALQRLWLPLVARGEAIAAFALSEPNAGSDVAAMTSNAIEIIATEVHSYLGYGQKSLRNDVHWQINGTKTWISNGGIADFYTTFVKTQADAGARGVSAFVVPRDAAGLDDSEHIVTMAPHPLATVYMRDVRLSDAQRVGDVNQGFKLAMRTLDVFRASVAAAALGFARRALAQAKAYVKNRPMFGATLADQQLTQAKLGEMSALIEAGAALTYKAAWMRDAALTPEAWGLRSQDVEQLQADYTQAAATAKLMATENAQRVIDMALQLHGGQGVRVGQKIEALYRDVRALRIYEGASEVQQLIIGKAVLKGQI
jgi:acyl-CoA dehydrogenase